MHKWTRLVILLLLLSTLVSNYTIPLHFFQRSGEIAEKTPAAMTDPIDDLTMIFNTDGAVQKAFAQDGPKGIRYEFTLSYQEDETGNFSSIAGIGYAARFEVVGGGTFTFAETEQGDFNTASSSGDTVSFLSDELVRGESKTGAVVLDYGPEVNQNSEVIITTYLTINGMTSEVGVIDPPASQGVHVRTIVDVLADGSLRARNAPPEENSVGTNPGQSSGSTGSQSGGEGGGDGSTVDGVSDSTGGGGCLIATAAFGSELSPQVQFLRDFRDGRILSTNSGSSFMNVFNFWYYSFSPYVADYERQQPWLQQLTKTAIYPLLGVLHIAEKAYSSIPGEFGALVAGAVASSLIGAVYFWPFSLLIIRKNNKRKKQYVSKLDYKVVLSVIGIAVIAAAVICSLVLSNNTILLMITTSLFILTILFSSAIFSAKAILRVSRRIGSLYRSRIA